MNKLLKKIVLATAGIFLALSMNTSAIAAENLFGFTKIGIADQQVTAMSDSKCGGSKDAGKKMEGKCGAGKCGGSKDAGKKMEGKCGAGKCGGK